MGILDQNWPISRKNLIAVRQIITNFKDSGKFIRNAKASVEFPNLIWDLDLIEQNYYEIQIIILKIESNTENIFEVFEIMRNFDFMQDPGKIKQYVVKRLEKN